MGEDAETTIGEVDGQFASGQLLLGDGQVKGALQAFSWVSPESAQWPHAQVGMALARLLLLPEHPAAEEIFRVLGADPARLPLDVETNLYGPGALFDRLAQGASLQLIEEAWYRALPWPRERVGGGATLLFADIDPAHSAEALRAPVEALVMEIEAIEGLLLAALEHGLDHYEIPVGLLYCPRSHTLRRSDVLALLATLRSVRGLAEVAMAYAWPVPLREALAHLSAEGEALELEAVAATLNAQMLRSWYGGWEQADVRLGEARVLLRQGVAWLIASVETAATEQSGDGRGVLEWLMLSTDERADVIAFFQDWDAALVEQVPVALRFSEPATYVSLAPFFAGRGLREGEAPLWVVVDDGVDGAGRLVMDEEEVERHFIGPYFEPTWSAAAMPDFWYHSVLRGSPFDVLSRLEAELRADYHW